MRAPTLLLAPMLLVPASNAGGQSLPYPQPDTQAMSTVQVTAPFEPVRVTADQARQIEGSYAMSNGWSLAVRTGRRHIEATIDRQQPMRLFAVSPYTFSSRDGSVVMLFNLGNWGDAMTMRYVFDSRMAQAVQVSGSLAARRLTLICSAQRRRESPQP